MPLTYLNHHTFLEPVFVKKTIANLLTDSLAIDDIEVFDGVSQPVADFVFSTPLCKGSAITFTDQSSGGSLNHSWNFGPNANPSSVTGPGPHVVVFNQGGLQDIWLAASNLAGSDTSFRTLDIDSLPNPGFTINVTGSSVSFNSSATNYLSIGYDFGDGNSSSGTPSPTHNYANSGLFVATQHLSNTCGVDSIQVPVLILGLKDYAAGSLGDRLQIYPNPVDQFLTLAWTGSSNLDFTYELTDLKGSVVLRSSESGSIGNKTDLDMSSIPAGVYILKVNIGGEWGVYKLEKM